MLLGKSYPKVRHRSKTHICPSIRSSPWKKERNLKAVRRYLQVASISEPGLLIHRKPNLLYGKDYELIIVPQNLAAGLISALHIRLGHPTKTQLKKLWDRYVFANHAEEIISSCTTCTLCTSLKPLPKELFEQSTSTMPTVIESSFSADVFRREKQRILVLVEKFSSFAVAQIIPKYITTTFDTIVFSP